MRSSPGAPSLFCEAQFARGAGLGTRLFPWARCRIFSELHGCPMLAPDWVQWRIGPLLRGGIELRAYHRQILLMGLFRTDGYVRGTARRRARHFARIDEPAALTERPEWRATDPAVVTFAGPGDFFASLAPYRERLLRALRADAHPKWVDLAARAAAPIGVNVRCAFDFRPAAAESDYFTKGAIRTPLPWFVRSLERVREVAGAAVPAVIVSDGTEEQLRPILQMPNVRFARPGCAISDLLTLSSARVLIGSGGSSFSAWASFLSGAPTVTHAGQSLEWFRLGRDGEQFIGELMPDRAPSPALARHVVAALG
jgi:hypothetical protein